MLNYGTRRALLGGRQRIPAVLYNATTTSCVVTDAANIQDLHDAAFTAEALIRADGYGEGNDARIFDKTQATVKGWRLAVTASGIYTTVYGETPSTTITGADEFTPDCKWHLITMQYDDGGDRKPYIWIDGIPIASYVSQPAVAGAITSDVGNDFYIGNISTGTRTFDGAIGAVRISNILRYTNGVPFSPWARNNPPVVDANTVWQTTAMDGAGAVLTDAVAANNGALSNHTWIRV